MLMKKLLLCASLVGISAGAAYWLYIKGKAYQEMRASSIVYEMQSSVNPHAKEKPQKSYFSEKMNQAKSQCIQAVCERHAAAGEIMKDAYRNTVEDFVSPLPIETVVEEEKESSEAPESKKYNSVMKELNSISEELNDLFM